MAPVAFARRIFKVRMEGGEGPTMTTLFTLVFVLAGWRVGLGRLADNSFLWHLRTGHRILDEGIPHRDVYSFTASGTEWVAQSWLAEALYAAIDRLVGPFGIRLLVALTGALVAGLAFRLAARLARDRIRAVGLVLPAVAASFPLWSERPLFLGLLALLGLVWLVEVPDSAVGRRPLIWLPTLMWLWANVHGTFALGFAYLALHLMGRWLDGAPPWQGSERRLMLASVVAAAICLVNPYGVGLLLFPIDLLRRGDILRNVAEWRSPDFRTAQGICFAAWIAIFVACLARGAHRPSRRDLLVSLPFLFLALWARRNMALAPFVALPVLARTVAVSSPRPELSGRLHRPVAALVLAVGALWTAEAAAQPHFRLEAYPVRAMRIVEREELLGRRLMTTDAWGGYIIARWWPAQAVFIDDRYDMYPVPLIEDYLKLLQLDAGWERVLDRYDIDVVVWKRKHGLVEFLERDPRWRRVHRDQLAVVYVRR